VPRLHRHPIVAAATIVAALFAVGVPAHAVEVTVPLPQTPVPIPQSEVTVTAPGADVNVGPGGVSASVQPQQAAAGTTGAPPQAALPFAAPLPPPASAPADTLRPTDALTPARRRAARASRSGALADAPPAPRGTSPAPARRSPTQPPDGAAAREREGRSARRAETRARPRSVARLIVERIPRELLAALLAMALFGAAMSLVWLRERAHVRAARRQAQVDALTGISNRLAFEQRLDEEWKRARRYDRPLGLLLLDLDGLKQVNDSGGHEAGDRMIRAAASRISDNIRQSDLGARLAGDEFVVLCPETPRDGLEQLGAKLTDRLEETGIAASVGWADIADGDVAPGELLARADAAMYQEKARRQGTTSTPTVRRGFATVG
jgi:diguanylate cyclase (GGDEF)-like protein